MSDQLPLFTFWPNPILPRSPEAERERLAVVLPHLSPGLIDPARATPQREVNPASPSMEERENFQQAISSLAERLDRIEDLLKQLIQAKTPKDWYTVEEVAALLGKAEFTVREWCRLERVHADKRRCGRGRSKEWMIAHVEFERIRNEGLLPQPTISTRIR